jgi:hypothetical protein
MNTKANNCRFRIAKVFLLNDACGMLCVKGERMNISSFDVDNYISLMALFPSVNEKVKLLKKPLLWVHEPLGACYYLSMLVFYAPIGLTNGKNLVDFLLCNKMQILKTFFNCQ